MLLLAPLTTLVVLATRVVGVSTADGDRFISMPITKRVNINGTLNIVQNDNRRSRSLLKSGQQREFLTPDVLLNDAGSIYTADIAVGHPPTHCESCQLSQVWFLIYSF